MGHFWKDLKTSLAGSDDGEKKVEYVELIYDLIFVYLLGRSNSLVAGFEGDFVPFGHYVTYVLCTLIAIQIWYFTVTLLNRYGANDPVEYIGLFVNMYLLYYLGEATRVQWGETYYQYNIAWILILLNLALQYFIKLRTRDGMMPWESEHIKFYLRLILVEAGIVLATLPVYPMLGIGATPVAMVAGICIIIFGRRSRNLMTVDFPHLTERVMLFVVFTFGEMIVGLSTYFDDGFSLQQVYFSLMAFLIVVGLFMTYGFYYDHILDREAVTNGTGYMQIHIFIIFALNNITVALAFMRDPAVDLEKKSAFLIASFLLYYIFLALAGRYTRYEIAKGAGMYRYYLGILFAFTVLMVLTYRSRYIGIFLAAALAFSIYALLRIFWMRYIEPEEREESGM